MEGKGRGRSFDEIRDLLGLNRGRLDGLKGNTVYLYLNPDCIITKIKK